MYGLEVFVEEVAQHTFDAAFLLKYERGGRLTLRLGAGVLPAFQQRLELVVELGNPLAFGRGAHDYAEIFWLDRGDELAQAHLLLGGLDFLRDGDLVAKGDEDHEAAGEVDLGGESRTFRRDGFFDNLHQQLASRLQLVGDCAVLVNLGFHLHARQHGHVPAVGKRLLEKLAVGGEVGPEVEIVQKGVFFVSHIHECGIEARHKLFYFCQIDVAHGVSNVARLPLQRHQPGVLEQSYGHIAGLNVYNEFAFHKNCCGESECVLNLGRGIIPRESGMGRGWVELFKMQRTNLGAAYRQARLRCSKVCSCVDVRARRRFLLHAGGVGDDAGRDRVT